MIDADKIRLGNLPARHLPIVFGALLSKHKEEMERLQKAHRAEIEALKQEHLESNRELFSGTRIHIQTRVEDSLGCCAARLHGTDAAEVKKFVEACTEDSDLDRDSVYEAYFSYI